jgi:hypothetical protein
MTRERNVTMKKGNLMVVMFALALAAGLAFVPVAQAMMVAPGSPGITNTGGGLQVSDGYRVAPTPGLRVSTGYQSGLPAAGLDSGHFVLGPTAPGKWGPLPFGTPGAATYSYMAGGTSCAGEFAGCVFAAIPAGFVAAIDAAFAAWSAVAGITFTLVADSGAGCAFDAAGCVGDIRIGMHPFDGPFGILAHAYYPPVNGVTAAGDLHFDSAECWETVSDGTGDGCFNIGIVATHEIGHSIGLDHTAVPCSLMNPFYSEVCGALAADDIAGGVFIYGPPKPIDGVPFPATLVLVGVGLLGLRVASRKRRA